MKLYTVWLTPDLLQGLKHLKERDGVSESESIRRALRAYLEARGAAMGDETAGPSAPEPPAVGQARSATKRRGRKGT